MNTLKLPKLGVFDFYYSQLLKQSAYFGMFNNNITKKKYLTL